jgi:hypothetical protein
MLLMKMQWTAGYRFPQHKNNGIPDIGWNSSKGRQKSVFLLL